MLFISLLDGAKRLLHEPLTPVYYQSRLRSNIASEEVKLHLDNSSLCTPFGMHASGAIIPLKKAQAIG